MAMDEKQINNSVVKAFTVLDCFNSDDTEWGVTELARKINLNKSTVYRILSTLERVGAIKQNPENEKYCLGLKLFELGNQVNIKRAFINYTHPALELVAERITETVHVGVLRDGKVFYVDKVESPLGLKISTQIGSFRPAHCTGLGKVLLSHCTEEEVNDIIDTQSLEAFTQFSITKKEKLFNELRFIKERGYALDREEFEIGLICVAIPIYNKEGEVIAGLSASGPASRFRDEAVHDYVDMLKAGAKLVEEKNREIQSYKYNLMANPSKYSTINYGKYLQLDKILGAQCLRSEELGKTAHDEMLFIITHQAYELWFKQVIHELISVMDMFKTNMVDERSVGVIVGRLKRVIEIQKLMVQQIGVLETMTPLDFLDFRDYLFPASGFQSYQFRKVETMLGLQGSKRITYNQCKYSSVFNKTEQETLEDLEEDSSMFIEVESWLERTPFLKLGGFNFLESYKNTVLKMIKREQENIQASNLNEKEKEMRLKMVGSTDTYFQSVLDRVKHEEMRNKGLLRLSYDATVAALFINLYRDEPILHGPFNLLVCLSEIDEQLTNWRNRHSQMVFRMLGSKIGTGGSSGHEYLKKTAEEHHIFSDFQSISTLLIPRSELEELPSSVREQLGFYFKNPQSNGKN